MTLISSMSRVCNATILHILIGVICICSVCRASKSKTGVSNKDQRKHGTYLDSVCFNEQVGILTLQGASGGNNNTKTPQKSNKKRRASFDKTQEPGPSDDSLTWKFVLQMYSCEWTEESFTPLNVTLVDTDISITAEVPKWCMARHSLANSLSLLIQTTPMTAKWLKICNLGTVLFDRPIDLSSATTSFPSCIVGRNDALLVFYCTSSKPASDVHQVMVQNGQIATTRDRDGCLEIWNARYGMQAAPGTPAIPFPLSSDQLCVAEGHTSLTVYTPMSENPTGLLTLVFTRSVGAGAGAGAGAGSKSNGRGSGKGNSSQQPGSYEVVKYTLSSREYSSLQLADPVTAYSQGSLSTMLGKLAPPPPPPPSATESTAVTSKKSKKQKTDDVSVLKDTLIQAQYANDLSEYQAVSMLYAALVEGEETVTQTRVDNGRAIALGLIKRSQGFSSAILSDCIRRHLSAPSAAVCMQIFAQLLYGVCTEVSNGRTVNAENSPEYDTHIQQIVCWLEAILDAHLSAFILGCPEKIDDKEEITEAVVVKSSAKTSKKKKKSKKNDESPPTPRLSLFRTALMALLKALTELESTQDMTQETLGLSCHLHRMLKGSTKTLARASSRGMQQQDASQSQGGWNNGGSGSGSGGLYQLEIIHY